MILDICKCCVVYRARITNPRYRGTITEFNKLFGIADNIVNTIDIFNKLEQEQYAEAFYNTVKFVVPKALGFPIAAAEMLFGIMYSETFNQSLLFYAEEKIENLRNCSNCDDQIASLENLKKIATDELRRIKKKEETSRHQKTCTCIKD